MCRILALLGCLLIAIVMPAQKSLNNPKKLNEWHGTAIDDDRIKILQTEGVITGFEFDPTNQIIYLKLTNRRGDKLKEKGKLVAYDLGTQAILWQRKMEYGVYQFYLHDTIPVFVDRNYSYALDRNSGEELWYSHVKIGFCPPGKPLGVGTFGTNGRELIGVDLHTGRKKWNYQGSRMEKLESIALVGDSGLVLSAEGLHFVNLNTGKGFSHRQKQKAVATTNLSYFSMAILWGALGVATVIFLNASRENPFGNRVGDDKSNILMRDSIIYFADQSDVMACDVHGQIIWSRTLPGGLVEPSKLFMLDDYLYIINLGRQSSPDVAVRGKIHFAKINPETGYLMFKLPPSMIYQEYITDFLIRDSTIVLVNSSGISEHSLFNLSVVNNISFGDPRLGAGFDRILNPPYFTYHDQQLDNQSLTIPNELFVLTKAGIIIAFTPEFEMKSVVRNTDIYTFSQQMGDGLILRNDSKSIVTNASNKVWNDFEFSGKLKFAKGYIFDIMEDKILIAPSSIFK